MPFPVSGRQKKLLAALGLAAVALALAAAFLLRGTDVRALFERGMGAIRGAGPWAFFGAMALLPAVGFPVMTFSLTAGSVFGERMGTAGVIAAALSAVTFNLILTYSLARWALRPWLSRLLTRLGYRLPELDSTDLTDLVILLRVTPGPPFFVQNYLLGLADAPLARYLAISCVVTWSYNTAFILFGDALLHGRGKVAILAVSAIVALVAATHIVRHHLASKKAGRAGPEAGGSA